MRAAIRAFGRAFGLAALLVLAAAAPASPADPEIRTIVERWYQELAKKEKGRPWSLAAPGFIDASPASRHLDTGARNLGPPVFTSLAATALHFRFDLESVRADSSFARVEVWERGYFYAWAAQRTYERAAATTFLLERDPADGRWQILAHQST